MIGPAAYDESPAGTQRAWEGGDSAGMETRGTRSVKGGALSTYDQLKDAIISGRIAPDEPLVESALARRFRVSRTPIREALSRLEQDGLVERRERGLGVRSRSPEEILDLYETRIALEVKAAEVAAERRTEFDLIRLRHLVEAGAGLDPDDLDGISANNDAFHAAVWAASRNNSLVDLLERLNLHLLRYPNTTLAFAGRWERALDEHRELVDAIAARDSARCASLADQHFRAARDIRLATWQNALVSEI